MSKFFRIIISLGLVLCLSCSFVFASDSAPEDSERRDDTIQQSVSTQTLRVSPSDTSGLHAIVLSLLGDYNPVVKDYTYQSSSGYYSHSIEITPDYSWIATALIFVVVLWSVFRIIGLALGGLRS